MKSSASSLQTSRLQVLPDHRQRGHLGTARVERRFRLLEPQILHSRCLRAYQTQKSSESAVGQLLDAIQGSERGVRNGQGQKEKILEAAESLTEQGKNQETTGRDIDASWKLLWTTEKETLFIIKNAKLFRTKATDIFQVIDTESKHLQNVITFENGAAFVVDSELWKGSQQRLNFKFSAAKLQLPSKTWKIPPFGKGWFDTVYLGSGIRVAKDIRGDTLVVTRDGPPRQY